MTTKATIIFSSTGNLEAACSLELSDHSEYQCTYLQHSLQPENAKMQLPRILDGDRSENVIFFHCGSGRLLPAMMDVCGGRGCALIQASSSLKDENGDPIEISADSHNFTHPFIDAPNLALPVLAQMLVAEKLGEMLKKIGISDASVIETHQATKKTVPKTACEFGRYLDLKKESIVSVREPKIQRLLLGIPQDHLGGHAAHHLNITSCGVELGLSTKVLGRRAYGAGLVVLIKKIIDMGYDLKPGYYRAQDLIFGD